MRHLSVPSRDVQSWVDQLRGVGLLEAGAKVQPHGEGRAIPLAQQDEAQWPVWLQGQSIVELEPKRSAPASWVERLVAHLPATTVEAHAGSWPAAHDRIGELVILRLDEATRPFGAAVGRALLDHWPAARLALHDAGVHGRFRVRRLEPLAVRTEDGDVLDATTLAEAAREALCSTRTRLREHGVMLEVDPGRVYTSPRLAGERQGTLGSARRLRARLGRPLRVRDPYAGVGPGVVPLLLEPGLVEEVWASDLNPVALELLDMNLERAVEASRSDPPPRVHTAVADALALATRPDLQLVDMLLVNLPHDSLEHLPSLWPLVATGEPSLVRGWAILAKDEMDVAQQALGSMVKGVLDPEGPGWTLEPQRSYSASAWFCRFEAWLRIEA